MELSTNTEQIGIMACWRGTSWHEKDADFRCGNKNTVKMLVLYVVSVFLSLVIITETSCSKLGIHKSHNLSSPLLKHHIQELRSIFLLVHRETGSKDR